MFLSQVLDFEAGGGSVMDGMSGEGLTQAEKGVERGHE
jgi:hypothetical protein